jgi:hypothetical protein
MAVATIAILNMSIPHIIWRGIALAGTCNAELRNEFHVHIFMGVLALLEITAKATSLVPINSHYATSERQLSRVLLRV